MSRMSLNSPFRFPVRSSAGFDAQAVVDPEAQKTIECLPAVGRWQPGLGRHPHKLSCPFRWGRLQQIRERVGCPCREGCFKGRPDFAWVQRAALDEEDKVDEVPA